MYDNSEDDDYIGGCAGIMSGFAMLLAAMLLVGIVWWVSGIGGLP